MPTCRECGVMKSSAEMRKGRRGGQETWFCKDKRPCSERRKEALSERRRTS